MKYTIGTNNPYDANALSFIAKILDDEFDMYEPGCFEAFLYLFGSFDAQQPRDRTQTTIAINGDDDSWQHFVRVLRLTANELETDLKIKASTSEADS